MLRRSFLAAALATPFATAFASRPSAAAVHAAPAMAGTEQELEGFLPPLKISPALRRRLLSLMAPHGRGAPGYQPHRRPYAVFDWDNTSIMNDCEETLFLTLIDRFAFRLSPADFAQVVRLDVPQGPLAAAYTTLAGAPVTFADLATDIEADYAALAEAYGTPAPADKLAQLATDERLLSSGPSCSSFTKPSATASAIGSATTGW